MIPVSTTFKFHYHDPRGLILILRTWKSECFPWRKWNDELKEVDQSCQVWHSHPDSRLIKISEEEFELNEKSLIRKTYYQDITKYMAYLSPFGKWNHLTKNYTLEDCYREGISTGTQYDLLDSEYFRFINYYINNTTNTLLIKK